MSKTILITGASRGIGRLAAKRLAERGHTVVASMRDVNGRNQEAAHDLESWACDKGLKLRTVEMDVTDSASVANAVSAVEREQAIDVLINNAGIMPVGVTEAFTDEQLRACMDVNFHGLIRATRAVLPAMRKRRRGLLLHLSSSAGRLAIPFFGVYCASKWAVEAYCETLHYELEEFDIRSVLIEPSGHATDLVKTAPQPADLNRKAAYNHFSSGGERMLEMFEAMFAEGEAITDASNVADQIAALVEAEESLPLRVCVGADMGVEQINACTMHPQATLIENLKPVYIGR